MEVLLKCNTDLTNDDTPFSCEMSLDIVDEIVKGVGLISCEDDLLNTFGVWDERCSLAMFEVIEKYTDT